MAAKHRWSPLGRHIDAFYGRCIVCDLRRKVMPKYKVTYYNVGGTWTKTQAGACMPVYKNYVRRIITSPNFANWTYPAIVNFAASMQESAQFWHDMVWTDIPDARVINQDRASFYAWQARRALKYLVNIKDRS